MPESLEELGVTKDHILETVDVLSTYHPNPQEWSGVWFLVDPRSDRLWDVKPTLRQAAKLANAELLRDFKSYTYKNDLLNYGLSLVKFEKDRKRKLGLNGNDLDELLDQHTLITANREIENGAQHYIIESSAFLSDASNTDLAYETGVKISHLRIERNLGNARRVKEALGLVCEGCGLDAEAAFGKDLAMSCIEAHHKIPVSETPEGGRTVTISDFAVLCAICHRLIHRLKQPDDLAGLKSLHKKAR